jgi:hypothetical protein
MSKIEHHPGNLGNEIKDTMAGLPSARRKRQSTHWSRWAGKEGYNWVRITLEEHRNWLRQETE